ncbi:MAG: nondiscriminating aspartyl-tRNA synthetase [Thermoproteota archaeon]|nr:nondiscriminating aspartyl-tRNA synthetase [Thermoproteota archaeon]
MLKRTHLTRELKTGEATISGWVNVVRDLGNVKFLIVRDSTGIAQVTIKKGVVDEVILKIAESLNPWDVIAIQGEVVERKNAPQGREIIPSKIEILSKAETPLPIDVSGKIDSNLDTRLDWRVLDLRRPETAAIFKIQAKMVEGIEECLRRDGYLQVFTPCLMGSASESGAEVFPVVYFDREAFLRQDPQLHRQLLIIAGFDKVFDLGPNWRAEPSHTPRHLCEHRACAVEFGFMNDETDMMRVEESVLIAALQKIKEECKDELDLLGKEISIPKTPFPELQFPKIYDVLKEFGKNVEFGEDYDRESEVILWKYVKEKFGSDFFFVNRFPFKVKPFYVMRIDEEPQWARSVDLIYKGLELSSGGQREHRYDKIVEQMREKEMTIEVMDWFTKFFKYGAPPHGGFCLGIERFIMQLLDISNVREAALFPRAPERLLP